MQTKFNFPQAADEIVYVRPVDVKDLPEGIQKQAGGHETLYSVHRADGAPVALVASKREAFALARENDLTAVNVH